MSEMTCSRCGNGPADGFELIWNPSGRLAHRPLVIPGAQCWDALGIRDGMVKCAFGHVMWPNEAVRAEHEYNAKKMWSETKPWSPAFRPRVIRFAVTPEEDYENGDDNGFVLPPGTSFAIFESDPEGVPYLACRDCARREWGSDAELTPYRIAREPRSVARSSKAKVSPVDVAGARQARLKSLLAEGPLTSADIALRLGESERTIQRELKTIGAVSTRDGRFIRWSVS